MSDHIDEVEVALHFDECKPNFCNAKSQPAWSMINLKKMKKLDEVLMENVKMKLLKVKCWATLAEVDLNRKYVDNVR